MLKLTYKSILLIISLFVTKNLIDVVALPWYWGNPQLATKMNYLIKQDLHPDTYFIGSSNIFRQIQPNIFDAQTQKPTNSFNLGNDGCFTEQNLYILDNTIKRSSNKIKYIFLELNGFDDLAPKRYRTTKSKYFTHLASSWARYKYLQASNLPSMRKDELLKQYLISYLDNIFKIGMLKDIIRYYTGQNNWQELLGKHKDGYLSLPGFQTKSRGGRDYIPIASRDLAYRLNWAYKQKHNTVYNQHHLELLTNYITELKNRHIHLFILLTPKEFKLETHTELMTLFNKLPQRHKIDLANPSKYYAFFETQNRWDSGHLNDQGAKLFTQELAKSFNSIIRQK